MQAITLLGGGFVYIVGAIVLLFSIKKGLFMLFAQAGVAIVTQSIKHILAWPRPSAYFADLGIDMPQTVEGVALYTAKSFPSGHTAEAFGFFICLALMVESANINEKLKPILQFVCLVAAVLCGYSRIYLSQHFLEDTLAGSLIGLVSAFLVYKFYYLRTNNSVGLIRYIKDKK